METHYIFIGGTKMDEMNKMDMVTTVTDTVSDVANSGNNLDFLKGGIAGVSLATVLVAGYHWLAKPLLKKARIKIRAAKAKRMVGATGGDVPRDVNEEYPIGK